MSALTVPYNLPALAQFKRQGATDADVPTLEAFLHEIYDHFNVRWFNTMLLGNRLERKGSKARVSTSGTLYATLRALERKGYIALAAVIFGNWRPWGAAAACLLFGFSSALAQRLPAYSDSAAVLFQVTYFRSFWIALARRGYLAWRSGR